jgi:hypothetical protein
MSKPRDEGIVMVGMNRDEYRLQYLKSHHWRCLSNRLIDKADGCCFCCGYHWKESPWNYDHNDELIERLEVHHVSYKNLGDEKPEDVIVVCSVCHDDIHALIDFQHGELFNAHSVIRTRRLKAGILGGRF